MHEFVSILHGGDFELERQITEFSICIVYIESNDNLDRIPPLVRYALSSGCKYFACIGCRSDEVEDFIDTILEDSIDGLDVATTSHRNESDDDVALFASSLIITENNNILFVYESDFERMRILSRLISLKSER